MSGPKVVNLEAIRRRRQRESQVGIRQLRDAVSEWQAALEQAGLLNQESAAETEAMFVRLENLRERQQWEPLFAELAARRAFFRQGTVNAQQAGIQRVAGQ